MADRDAVQAWLQVLVNVEQQRERSAVRLTDDERERLRGELAGLADQLRERRQMIESFARLTGPDSILTKGRR